MKHVIQFLLLFLVCGAVKGQILNNEFELWDLYNGREKPQYWFCPNLSPGPNSGPCDKILDSENDFAVRIHNVMPCVSSDNQAKSRATGFIHSRFKSPFKNCILSFQLNIDSIESPAIFRMTLFGVNSGNQAATLIWEYSELMDERIEHEIEVTSQNDSLFILLEAIGSLKPNAAHDCDLGYLSAVIDSMELDEIVSNENPALFSIQIYPNPVTSSVNIISTHSLLHKVELYNLLGQKVFTKDSINSNSVEMDMNGLDSQLFILTISTSDKAITTKILKI